jgi:hypothetical protein
MAACGAAAACPPGGSFRWINAIGAQAGPLELTINARAIHHGVIGPRVTQEAKVGWGKQVVVVAGKRGVLERFEWEVEGPQRALLVTGVAAGGAVQTRVLAAIKWARGEQGARIVNAAGGWSVELTSARELVRLRPGRETLVRARREITGRFVHEGGEAMGFKIVLPEKPERWEVVALLGPAERGGFLFVRESDGRVGESWALEEGEDWPTVVFDAPVAPAVAGGIAAADLDWSKVESRVCWFNACQTREGLSFICNGTVAFQRGLPGTLSGFVKWPAGKWDIAVSGTRSGELGRFAMVVAERAKVFVLTTGGKGQDLRSLVMVSDLKQPARVARVRVVNGFSAGTLRLAGNGGAPRSPAIKPAQCGALMACEDGWFGGATIDASGGLRVVLPRTRLAPGDWLAVCHLDPEAENASRVTWVEMSSGRIVEPGEPLGVVEPAAR